MSATLDGLMYWDLSRDRDGHRDYTANYQVHVDDDADGPAIVLACPGLPAIGAPWQQGNDYDPWAYCWPDTKVTPRTRGERGNLWDIETKFSTRPFSRCQDNSFQNPISEPPRIGGSWIKFTKEAAYDINGRRVANPAHEPWKIEIDDNRPTVTIGFNVIVLPLGTYASMVDTVNDFPLWGLPPRCVKLCNLRWQRQVYGTCSYYYTVDLEFEINFNTWDIVKQNDATKRLRTGGNAANPTHFELIRAAREGDPVPGIVRADGTLWDGISPPPNDPPRTLFQFYQGSNFFNLGIPTQL
jgi:hypothetical protein